MAEDANLSKLIDGSKLALFWSRVKVYIDGKEVDTSDLVTKSGAETISGPKTFSAPMTLKNSSATTMVQQSQASDGSYRLNVGIKGISVDSTGAVSADGDVNVGGKLILSDGSYLYVK